LAKWLSSASRVAISGRAVLAGRKDCTPGTAAIALRARTIVRSVVLRWQPTAGMMYVVTDLANWKSRAADLDPTVAAEMWTDPSAPVAVLRDPPAAVVEYLLGDGVWQGGLSAALRNPALPKGVMSSVKLSGANVSSGRQA
jgi:hypothetical protein